jgi:molybdopterin/thiamine biosynthesis adenylyltransferase
VSDGYARQVAFPEWDPAVLRKATVVVVGVGGLGTEVARLLAQSGIGRMVLCDPDVVEKSNLSRGTLFSLGDVDQPKVEVAKRALLAIAPATVVDTREDDFRYALGLGELGASDLVLSCLDTVEDRITLCTRTFLSGSAHGVLDAGTQPWGGEIRHFTRDGSCYVCGCPPVDRSLPTWHEACGWPEQDGASAPVTALVASWQAMYAVHLLYNKPLPAEIIRIDAPPGRSLPVEQKRDEDCPCHNVIDPGSITRTRLTNRATVAQLLALAADGEQVQSWNPIDRANSLSSLSLRRADPDARLHELGIPPAEMLPAVSVRPAPSVRYLALREA